MKAIICSAYGQPEDLTIQEVLKPGLKEHEVMVRIHATTINDYEWSLVRGKPTLYRLLFGLRKPKNPIPGMELSGIVTELGPKVSNFKVGDAVYGDLSDYSFGSFAEFLNVNEKALVHKPDGMSFEDAASLPHASLLAFQGLIEMGRLKKGQNILINGAGGGVGTFGLQLAKQYDAIVTGVDTGEKLETMKELGFDHAIDYKQENFTKLGVKYDVILDAKTSFSPWSYPRVLNENGRYVSVGGTVGKLIRLLFAKFWIRLITKKDLRILPLKSNKGLDHINELYHLGKLKPVIDGPHAFEEIPNLIRRFGEGKHTGKIVIGVAESQ